VASLRGRIAAAAARAGRNPAAVTLVGVGKRHSPAALRAAHAAGVRCIGESYAQELLAKQAALGELPGLAWHFVGRLQQNKVKSVVGHVALVHAVDSDALLDEIDRRAAAGGVVQEILVAVNLAGEAQKSGVGPDAAPALVARAAERAAVCCVGLMCMPPYVTDPEQSRPHFHALRALRDGLATPTRPLPVLSMGTSVDFDVAVEEGATLVRVGTALFGPRGGAILG
jgi:pyridoxal phosphate enzyme (YggS family)